MKYILEALNKSGDRKLYEVDIETETCPYNPRTVYDHPYTFMSIYTKDEDYSDFKYSSKFQKQKDLGMSDEQIILDAKKKYGDKVDIKTIYGYSHSGLTLSLAPFSDKWDSGIAGHMLVFKDGFKDEESLNNYIEKEIQEMNEYFSGENIYQATVSAYNNKKLAYLYSNIWDFGAINNNKSDIFERVQDYLYNVDGFSEMRGYELNSREGQELIREYTEKSPILEVVAHYPKAELTLYKINDGYALFNRSYDDHIFYFNNPLYEFSIEIGGHVVAYEKDIIEALGVNPVDREVFFQSLANDNPTRDDLEEELQR